jgi:hypothetical protein
MCQPKATFEYAPGMLDDALKFLKRTRSELRELRRVRVWSDRFRVYDVNGDAFEILRIGYRDHDIVPILEAVNTVYKPESIHAETEDDYKEFKTGRRYPWAADRVM